jgi:hypothetical protein
MTQARTYWFWQTYVSAGECEGLRAVCINKGHTPLGVCPSRLGPYSILRSSKVTKVMTCSSELLRG